VSASRHRPRGILNINGRSFFNMPWGKLTNRFVNLLRSKLTYERLLAGLVLATPALVHTVTAEALHARAAHGGGDQ